MRSNKQPASRHQTGFSLIEILVGLVIGLLATLVIMQVFSVFEGQKRTTTGSADAQTNGSIALYTMENELQMAGFGLMPSDDSPLECTTVLFGATGITDISPVTITDGGNAAGASDTITIRYANSASGGVYSQITGGVGTGAGLPTANSVGLNNNMACHVNDISMLINGTTCYLTSVNGPTDIAIPPVPSSPPDTKSVELQSINGAANDVNLSCLGAWVTTVFRVNPNYDPTVATNSQAYLERDGVASVADIVNIQAQYGISAVANSNQVNQWVDATGGWAAPTVADRNRIKAVRIAVVARNGLREKSIVTYACSSLTATSPVGLCAWDATSAAPTIASPAPAINLSNDPNWQYYRYRVFETIIPLRNMIWAKDTL